MPPTPSHIPLPGRVAARMANSLYRPAFKRPVRWVLALLALLPGLGIALGPLAIFFGTLGLRLARRTEDKPGFGHAFVSRIVGLVSLFFHSAGIYCLGRACEWW